VLDLTLEEIDQGVERTVVLKRADHCQDLQGNGREGRHLAHDLRDLRRPRTGQREPGLLRDGPRVPDLRRPRSSDQVALRDLQGRGQGEREGRGADSDSGRGREGVRLRVAGEGDAGDPGAPRGDLYCVVRELEHKIYQRSGADVITEIPVRSRSWRSRRGGSARPARARRDG
jgi:molecular chaperone DnaJ